MYYVNQEQIDRRLQFIPVLLEASRALTEAKPFDAVLSRFALEHTLYLAIETVTDLGSLLIDAFMMRDASSYEDIIDILEGEQVFGAVTARTLRELVQLRRLLTQEYMDERSQAAETTLFGVLQQLPDALTDFAEAIPAFINREKI
ncbi:DUF86 domain-containing protein [Paenibacillus sp. YYML68]|uniref:DUF86 domain-containing protein n=1 Tax=Paenibacillus sp. YYML68 TaxID=2909250 RepID=UPI002492ACB3|nr:HepT-like ribonuclease domain-containing protein [Paenibacillus sp. YYML68]